VDVPSREVIASVPVGLVGGAHHTEHRMPPGNVFVANSFTAGDDVSLRCSCGASTGKSGEKR
jgi:hypothetical protein